MFSLHLFQNISGKSQKIGDFTFCRPFQILPIYQISAWSLSQDSPNYEFAGIWKVRQELKLEHKCNSITATWMHTSLCCVVLNTSVFLNSSMQFSILEKQKPTKRRGTRFWIREYLKKRREIWSVPHTVFQVSPIFAYTWILLNQVTLKSFASHCSLCSDL